MKNVLLFVLIMAAGYSCFANGTTTQRQTAWRWRNNDGNEAAATWKAPVSTGVALTGNNEVLRLRTEVTVIRSCPNYPYNCDNVLTITQRDSLQYTTNPSVAASWKNIGTDGTKDFRLAVSNSYVNQNETTTPQINNSTLPFNTGKIMVSDSVINNLVFAYDTRSEFEWTFAPTANLLPGTTYYFRQRGSTTLYFPLFSLSSYPSLSTPVILPIKLTGFSVKNEGKKAKLEWTTTSEHNNDRFEVQRSNDQRTWQTIATIKGRGSTTVTATYATYDDNPLPGVSYYRLQQFDIDGKFTFSGVQLFRMMQSSGLAVSVWPNPTAESIYFSMGSAGKVEVILSNAGGKIVHRETFTNVQSGTTNKLHLQAKLAPGIYLLQLSAGGLSKNLKVVVQ